MAPVKWSDRTKTDQHIFRGLFLLAIAAAFCSLVRAQPLPWFAVPILEGPAGQFTCVTTPDPQYGAKITCDPSKMAALPPAVRAFLVNHEYGHVVQIRLGRTLFVPNPEADADCYAARRMRSNPDELNAALAWMRGVLGTGGGDRLHGNGLQVAAFAEQCSGRADQDVGTESGPATKSRLIHWPQNLKIHVKRDTRPASRIFDQLINAYEMIIRKSALKFAWIASETAIHSAQQNSVARRL